MARAEKRRPEGRGERGEISRDSALMRYLCEEAWPLRESVLDRMIEVFTRHADGVKLTAQQIEEAIHAAGGAPDDEGDAEPKMLIADGVGIVPIFGVIAKHAGMVNGVSQPQGSSVERISEDLAAAEKDPRVQAVLLQIESPGGSIGGLPELAADIRALDAVKPVFAFVDDQAASAAYWLASQARGVFATRGAAVGSIGVYTILADTSERASRAGVRLVKIRSGPFKGTAEPGTPIDDAELAPIQARIDALYNLFVQDVAAARGLDMEALLSVADGRVLTGVEAADAGLIDGVKTYEQTLALAREAGAAPSNHSRPGRNESATAGNGNGLAENRDMAEKETPKIPTAADLDAIKADARAEAIASERKRVLAVSQVLAGLPALLAQALADGSVGEIQAQAMLVPVLTAQVTDLTAKLADAEKRLALVATNGGQKALAQGATADGVGAGAKKPGEGTGGAKADDGKAETYEARVAALAESNGRAGKPRSDDYAAAAKELPESFEGWKDAHPAPTRR